MRNCLGDNPFRLFWAAQTVSQFGDRVSELALPLLAVTLLHASAGQIGLLTAAIWVPYLGSFLIGSWVDRFGRQRRVLVGADLARATLLLSLPIAWGFGVLTLPQVFVVALLNGLGAVYFTTAAPAVFVTLVPREAYLSANSRLSTTRSASFIAGPALGGALVQALTAPIAVLADALSFLVSATLIARLRPTAARERFSSPIIVDEESDNPTAGRRALEGLRFLAGHPYLRLSLAGTATLNFFSLIGSTLLVLFANRTLGLSAGLIGLALGVGAAGGLLGALIAPRLGRRFGIGPVLIAGAAVYPAGFAVAAVAGGPPTVTAAVLALSEFVGGLGVMLFDINANAVQTTLVPDRMRSRVTGAFSTVNYGVRPLGALVGGGLGATIGLRPTLLVAAVGGAASVLWFWFSPARRVRTLADFDEVLPPPQPVASASVGASRAARRAGYSPATAPTTTAVATPPASATPGSTSGQSR